jgi:putative ABC transport system permease protein
MENKPPKIAKQLLKNLLHKESKQTVIGDFEEIYHEFFQERGSFFAKVWYWWQIFYSLPSFIIRSFYWSMFMFLANLKISIRNIKRQKLFSFINIFGLAAGLASSIFILLWIQDELNFDRFHEKVDQIHRIYNVYENQPIWPGTPGPLANWFKTSVPEVIKAARMKDADGVLHWQNKKLKLSGRYVEPEFFEIFSFPFVKGDSKSLSEVGNIVLTEKTAKMFFGEEEPIGKVLHWDKKYDYKITGVIKDIPKNSTILTNCDFLVSFKVMSFWRKPDSWEGDIGDDYNAWVLLDKNVTTKQANQKADSLLAFHKVDAKQHYYFEPLTKMHLHPIKFRYPDGKSYGNYQYVIIFFGIAFFILLIACINFINLSTSRSLARAKEIGIRKVVGAFRNQLVKQLFSESFFYALIATAFAFGLVLLLLNNFNHLVGKEISLEIFLTKQFILGILTLVLLTGAISGGYPAFLLSSYQPVKILKGSFFTKQKGRTTFRKMLVVFQFVLSIFVLIGTFTIFSQLKFVKNKDLGYNHQNLLYFGQGINHGFNVVESMKNELRSNPDILQVTRTSDVPKTIGWINYVTWQNPQGQKGMSFHRLGVDYDFLQAYKIGVSDGRFFSNEYSTDEKSAIVLNETAAKIMEMDSPVGKSIKIGNEERTIVGIVKDFHFSSLHEAIAPLFLVLDKNNYFWNIKVSSVQIPETIKFIKATMNKYYPENAFVFHFLDQELVHLYRAEQQMSRVITYFSILAILISCLGLVGLAAFMAERRTKEIGIRKVLGASVSGIISLFTKEFTMWIILAGFIACPIAWFGMNKWLHNFAYRTDLSIWIFLFSIGIVAVIAILTVTIQTFRAANEKPANSLRYE